MQRSSRLILPRQEIIVPRRRRARSHLYSSRRSPVIVMQGENAVSTVPQESEEQVVRFRSLWDTGGLGTSSNNLRNAGAIDGQWDDILCPGNHGLEAVARNAAGVGWTGPGNCLQITTSGAALCGQVRKLVTNLTDGDGFRIGYGFKAAITGGQSSPSFHCGAIHPLSDIQGTYHAIHAAHGGVTYRQGVALSMSGGSINQWGPAIPQTSWNWHEIDVEVVNFALRRFRIRPYAWTYPGGVPLSDPGDHLEDFGAGPETLEQMHDNGEYVQFDTSGVDGFGLSWEQWWRQFGIGNDGNGGAGTNNHWYFACYTIVQGSGTPIGLPPVV